MLLSNTRAVAPDWVKMAAPLPSVRMRRRVSFPGKKAPPPRYDANVLTFVPIHNLDRLRQRLCVDHSQHWSEDFGADDGSVRQAYECSGIKDAGGFTHW